MMGAQSSMTNGDFFKLSLYDQKWEHQDLKCDSPDCCPARDDHAAVFDENRNMMYVFGGYVNGDKSNDMWKYNLMDETWHCLHKGDYKEWPEKQRPKQIPAPRIGAKLIMIDHNTLLIQNGHDNENEKLSDMWKFDLRSNTWSQVR